MKVNSKFKMVFAILIISIFVLSTTSNGAVLQSTPDTHQSPTQSTFDYWIRNIRQMENGAMGLSENIDGNTLEGNDNNIDVHMAKNTEYGAMAILSMSNYGNVEANNNKLATPETSSGNATGVYLNYGGDKYGELTAGLLARNEWTYNPKYYNAYQSNASSPFIGDAEDEFGNYTNRQTIKYHVTSDSRRFSDYSGWTNLSGYWYTMRGYSSLLSYDAKSMHARKALYG